MKNAGKYFIVVILISTALATACTDPPVPKLNYYDREIVDSLYLIRYDSLKDYLDTLCVEIEREVMETAVDSIMQERLEEIAELKNRYRKQ